MLKNIRTDLAVECLTETGSSLPPGVHRDTETIGQTPVTRVVIETEQAAQTIGKPVGKYVTVETTPFHRFTSDFENQVKIVGDEIKNLLPDGPALVVGLGNSAITPDALGPEVINLIFATRHLQKDFAAISGFEHLRGAAAIAPGVLGQTGIETAEIISAIVQEIKPSAVVVIDALASREIARLGATVQISDTGIAPGSGVANHRKELTEKSLGVPVIAVGVPTVVDMNTIAEDLSDGQPVSLPEKGKNMMVTPREIDTIIENAAKTVAFGINLALQPSLSLSDVISLVN